MTRNVMHAACGAAVTVTRTDDGKPEWFCAKGHQLIDPMELTPRPPAFVPKPRVSYERPWSL